MFGNKAPQGKFRVLSVTFFPLEEYKVKDYFSKIFAIFVADKHNKSRSNLTEDVYRVYDERGDHVPGMVNP